MYKAEFRSASGQVFVLGVDNNLVFDISEFGGVPVDVGTAQAFAQVGETVITQSVSGAYFVIKGVIFNDIPSVKDALRKAFAPFTMGDLIFEDGHFIRVYVKTSPVFHPAKDNGKFSLQLYAPLPFFKRPRESVFSIGKVVSAFSFPVNYTTPHRFGTRNTSKYLLITNNGDIKTPFSAEFTTNSAIRNFSLIEVETQRFLKFNGELNVGETLSMYRDPDGFLRVDLIKNNEAQDAFAMLDEKSNLFEFEVGSTTLTTTNDLAGLVEVEIRFHELVGAVYEH